MPLIALAFVATLLIESRELRRIVGRAPAETAEKIFDELDDERVAAVR